MSEFTEGLLSFQNNRSVLYFRLRKTCTGLTVMSKASDLIQFYGFFQNGTGEWT